MGKIDPDVELVARAIFGYNHCPGTPVAQALWPPKTKQQLMHYLNLGEAVIKAQREATCAIDMSRCPTLIAAVSRS